MTGPILYLLARGGVRLIWEQGESRNGLLCISAIIYVELQAKYTAL